MEELLTKFRDHLELERGASVYTLRNYTSDIREFLGFLRSEEITSLDMVDQPLLRRYLAWLLDQGKARSSIARKMSALRSFYRYLTVENLISSNPLDTSSAVKQEKRLPGFLSLEDINRMLAAPNAVTPQGLRDRAILEMLYACGLRVSEIVKLDLEQV